MMTVHLSFSKREMKMDIELLPGLLLMLTCGLCMVILISLLANIPAIVLRLAKVEKSEIDLQIMPEKRSGYSINCRQMSKELARIETNQKNATIIITSG